MTKATFDLVQEPLKAPFERFRANVLPEIQEVTDLLNKPLDEAPAVLNEQVRSIESWYGRLTTLLAHANAFLDLNTRDRMPERGEGTDLDRKAEVEAAVARERDLRDQVQGLTKAVELRVSLVQSIMRANNSEGRMGT